MFLFFSTAVSECPADDESNSVVPIAVGAALAGLVVIVLIAYLIGRRRSRRQGYESV
jgi:lysosomal-associated membrane protein 1/2